MTPFIFFYLLNNTALAARPLPLGCSEIGCCPLDFHPDDCKAIEKIDDGQRECRCDAKCKLRKDCCQDYDSYCFYSTNSKDCSYFNWSEWDSCKGTDCNGYQKRFRRVKHFGNNEKPCRLDEIVDYRSCGGRNCLPILKRLPLQDRAYWENLHEEGIVSAHIASSNINNECVISKKPIPRCLMCDSLHSIHCLELMMHKAIDFIDFKLGCTGSIFLTSGPEIMPCPSDFQGEVFILEKNPSFINGKKNHRRHKRSVDEEDEFTDPKQEILNAEFGQQFIPTTL